MKAISDEIRQHIVAAGVLLKKDFPGENMQICFNIAKQHDNVNFNVKISGIECPAKTYKIGKETNMKTKLIVLAVILLAVCGCNEVQVTKEAPILMPNEQWKAKYGNSRDSQTAYNLALSRDIDSLIVRTMNKMHPADVNDPNNLKARIDNLETWIINHDTKESKHNCNDHPETAVYHGGNIMFGTDTTSPDVRFDEYGRAYVPDNLYEAKPMETKTLKTLEEHNAESRKATDDFINPHPNGIACPECGAELIDSTPMLTLLPMPAQYNVHCEKCNWKGTRY